MPKSKIQIEVGQFWQLQMNRSTKGGGGRVIRVDRTEETAVGANIYNVEDGTFGKSILIARASLLQNYKKLNVNALGHPILPPKPEEAAKSLVGPLEEEKMRLYDEIATLKARIEQGSRKFKECVKQKEELSQNLDAALQEKQDLIVMLSSTSASDELLSDIEQLHETCDKYAETSDRTLKLNDALLQDLAAAQRKVQGLEFDLKNTKNAHKTAISGIAMRNTEINQLRRDLEVGSVKRFWWKVVGYKGESGQA